MNSEIFGYDWSDIQRAQQGGRLHKPVNAVAWTEFDESVYQQHPSPDKLRLAGFHGTASRLQDGRRPVDYVPTA